MKNYIKLPLKKCPSSEGGHFFVAAYSGSTIAASGIDGINNSGTGGYKGGNGISGSDLTITNNSSITGGNGGSYCGDTRSGRV